jgi:membrane protein YdbS with pleckstrin-like domain
MSSTTPAPDERQPAAAVPASPTPPSIADGVVGPLDPRFITVQRIVGWIVMAVMSLAALFGFTILLAVSPLPGWALAVLAVLLLAAVAGLAWLAHFWPEIEHRHAFYRVDPDGIEIRRGVVWRTVTDVPRSRVQHTDVSQGPLERRYGLGTLVIYTAGTDYARVDLPGLDHESALRIRDHLLPRDAGDVV